MTDINQAKQALLAEWERERDELDRMISRLRRELGLAKSEAPSRSAENGAAKPPISSEVLVQPGDFFGMTQVEAVKDYLQKRGKRNTATLQEIAAALYRGKQTDKLIEGDGLRNLSSILSRGKDDFLCVARGRWGLVEWYPPSAVKRAQKTSEEEVPKADADKTDGD